MIGIDDGVSVSSFRVCYEQSLSQIHEPPRTSQKKDDFAERSHESRTLPDRVAGLSPTVPHQSGTQVQSQSKKAHSF